MDSLSIICVVVGALVILRRGPLIFAPRATLRVYGRVFLSTNTRVRALGVGFATLAMALLFSDFGEGALAGFFHAFGWLITTVALLLLVVPNVFRRFIQPMFDYIEKSVGDGMLRLFDLLGVVIGLALIYVGFYVV